MKKLVLQEIYSDFPPVKIKKPYNYIITITLAIIFIGFFSAVCVNEKIYIIILFQKRRDFLYFF